jgi:endonuclease YncB( thermonuclease family)
LAAQDVPADYGQNGYPQQSPVVIINQSYQPDVVNPVLRDYSNTPLPEAVPQQGAQFEPQAANSDEPTIYLIAMKDRTIYATVAYWVDGETLNYITREGSPNRVSLDLVDRDFSKQLNEERHVDFKLPAAK